MFCLFLYGTLAATPMYSTFSTCVCCVDAYWILNPHLHATIFTDDYHFDKCDLLKIVQRAFSNTYQRIMNKKCATYSTRDHTRQNDSG